MQNSSKGITFLSCVSTIKGAKPILLIREGHHDLIGKVQRGRGSGWRGGGGGGWKENPPQVLSFVLFAALKLGYISSLLDLFSL